MNSSNKVRREKYLPCKQAVVPRRRRTRKHRPGQPHTGLASLANTGLASLITNTNYKACIGLASLRPSRPHKLQIAIQSRYTNQARRDVSALAFDKKVVHTFFGYIWRIRRHNRCCNRRLSGTTAATTVGLTAGWTTVGLAAD